MKFHQPIPMQRPDEDERGRPPGFSKSEKQWLIFAGILASTGALLAIASAVLLIRILFKECGF